jgi:hypothetical protein
MSDDKAPRSDPERAEDPSVSTGKNSLVVDANDLKWLEENRASKYRMNLCGITEWELNLIYRSLCELRLEDGSPYNFRQWWDDLIVDEYEGVKGYMGATLPPRSRPN